MTTKKIIIVIIGLLICILLLPLSGCDELNPPGTDEGNLSSLTISAGTLSPAFDSATTEYSIALQTGTSSITITPTASNASDVIKVDAAVVASGTASGAIALAEGLNTIAIEVASAEGTVLKTYTLKIIVGGFKISGTMILTNGEDGSGKNYHIGVRDDLDLSDADTTSFDGEWLTGSTQSFELTNVPPGNYYLYVIIDWNGDDDYTDVYPDYAGIYGWVFSGSAPPETPNLIITDKDVTANIDDIQQIPEEDGEGEDGTITVNLVDAVGYEGDYLSIAIYDGVEPFDVVAGAVDFIIADGSAGSVAYVDPAAEPPLVEFIATGGGYYHIYARVIADGEPDYDTYIENVFIDGDMTFTVDFDNMDEVIPEEGEDGTITVNLINAGSEQVGKTFGIAVFEDDDFIAYVASAYDFITAGGTAGSLAYVDPVADPLVTFTAFGGDVYDIHVMVDMNSNGITDNGDYAGMIQNVDIDGDMTFTVDFAVDMYFYVEPE